MPFTSFALFMGVAMSITAFPVLARILTDRDMTHDRARRRRAHLRGDRRRRPRGVCWRSSSAWRRQHAAGPCWSSVLTLGFIARMFVRRAAAVVARLVGAATDPHAGGGTRSRSSLVALLLSALTTEAIGIHAIFGAFLFGAIIPHDSAPGAGADPQAATTWSTVLLLPAFFAFTGHADADRPRLGLQPTGCSAG